MMDQWSDTFLLQARVSIRCSSQVFWAVHAGGLKIIDPGPQICRDCVSPNQLSKRSAVANHQPERPGIALEFEEFRI
jgi:hypothetical protein